MTPHWQTDDGSVRLYVGDVRKELAGMAAESVHVCATSPPYWGHRSYGTPPTVWGGDDACEHAWGDELPVIGNENRNDKGSLHSREGATSRNDATSGAFCLHCHAWLGSLGLEPTVGMFVEHMVKIFREVRRVLHPSGVALVNLGDSYAANGACGGASPVGDREYRAQDRKAQEGMRNRVPNGLKPKDLCMVPARVAIALQADGWWLRSEIVWIKGVSMCEAYSGSVMPESATDRPTSATERIYLLAKSAKYFWDSEAVREANASAAQAAHNERYAYEYKATTERSPNRVPGAQNHVGIHARPGTNGRNLRNAWYAPPDPRSLAGWTDAWVIGTKAFRAAHFATFSPKLAETMIRAGSSAHGCCSECGARWERVLELNPEYEKRLRSGGAPRTTGWRATCSCDAEVVPCTVLDPFSGSGTCGEAAIRLGRRYLGIDLSQAYTDDIAIPRLQQALDGLSAAERRAGQGALFA